MASNEKVIASLLNSARPAFVEGWTARDTGCGELTVRNARLKRYATLPIEALGLLEFLDGSRTLNQVAGALLEKAGRVRHHLILDAVARLYAAGLLEPLDDEIAGLLSAQTARTTSQRFLGFIRAASSHGIFLPVRMTFSRAWLKPGNVMVRLLLGLFVVLYPLSLVPYLRWIASARAAVSVFGAHPVSALMSVLLGLVVAMSVIGAARTLLLLGLGRTVYGFGLRLTVGVPNLSADHRDEIMLNNAERLAYRAGVLAILCLAALAFSVAQLMAGSSTLFYIGFGIQLALLADLSPLWPGDFCHLLEEALSSRRLRRSSKHYVVRKLWRNLVKKGGGRQELILMLFGSAWILYLFIAAVILAWLAPGTIDAVTSVMLSPVCGMGELVLALLAALYLWVALLFFTVAIFAAFATAVAQLLSPGRGRDKPFEVQQVESMSLESLADELNAIPPFSGFSLELVMETLSGGRLEKYRAGRSIIRQGEPGDTCYVLRSGLCRVLVEGPSGLEREAAVLGPGHLFGEVALLSSSARTASVVAAADASVIAIDGETFLALVEGAGQDKALVMEQVRVHLFLKEIELLRGISSSGMAALMKSYRLVRPKRGECVVNAGDAGDAMFVIFKGSCRVADADGAEVAVLGEGDYFGEIALVTGAVRSATVSCLEDSVLVELPAELYQDVIVKEFATGVLLDREVEARLEDLSLV